jgi:hypothetical protein
MGSKIERVVLVFIILVVALAYYLIGKKHESVKVINAERTTELNDLVEYDINKTNIMAKLIASQAYQINGVWFLTKPVVSTDEIEYLKSDRSLAKNGIIQFLDNVMVQRKDGKYYTSDKTFYKIKTKKIITPSKFMISKEYDLIRGASMVYDTATQTTKAKNVTGTFILKREK